MVNVDVAVKKQLHPYYSFDKVFSYNAYFNFIVGGRGLGKTYGAKKKAIKAAITNGEQFIYLRRYKEELTDSVRTFFDDLVANGEFDEYDFRVNGRQFEYSGIEFRDEKKREWHLAGMAMALSQGQAKKSMALPLVTLIIFDEFIIEKGHMRYLPFEYNVFQGLYSTVDRWKDKTRVLFLANAVSIDNPYFVFYGIIPEKNQEWIHGKKVKLKDGRKVNYICAHFPVAGEFAASVSKTAFGQFIAGTEYEAFAISNQFADNDNRLIGNKVATARYKYTIITHKGRFSVWRDANMGAYYIQKKLPNNQLMFTLEDVFVDEDVILLLRNDPMLSFLRAAFRRGRMFFDEPLTRTAFMEVFKR